MLQLGRYEQIGSGVYNVSKYVPIYSHGGNPQFDEQADLFVTTIPLAQDTEASAPEATPDVAPDVGTKLGPSRDQVEIMQKCVSDSAISELMALTGRTNRTKFRDQVLNPLLSANLIAMTSPDKPNSRLQKYRLTDKGRAWMANIRP